MYATENFNVFLIYLFLQLSALSSLIEELKKTEIPPPKKTMVAQQCSPLSLIACS